MSDAMMKAISLMQPWASLWFTAAKIHETRSWSTKHRGWLAVQASMTVDRDADKYLEPLTRRYGLRHAPLPRGMLLGMVYLENCFKIGDGSGSVGRPLHQQDEQCGNWEPGRFAWRRGQALLLPEPVMLKGARGLFDVSEALLSPEAFHRPIQ